MNRAEYLSTAVAGGGNGLYPLSTQGLSFIQDQITFLQAFARIGGKRYILLAPTATTDGVVVIDGEVLRFKAAAKPGNGIQIRETTENMYAITLGEHPRYQIPALDFRGTPCGIDAMKVVETGITPVLNTAIAAARPGVGMVGAGMSTLPVEPFAKAITALAEEMGI